MVSPDEREKVALRNTDPMTVGYIRKRLVESRRGMTYAKEDSLLRQNQGRVQELTELLELITGKKEDGG